MIIIIHCIGGCLWVTYQSAILTFTMYCYISQNCFLWYTNKSYLIRSSSSAFFLHNFSYLWILFLHKKNHRTKLLLPVIGFLAFRLYFTLFSCYFLLYMHYDHTYQINCTFYYCKILSLFLHNFSSSLFVNIVCV